MEVDAANLSGEDSTSIQCMEHWRSLHPQAVSRDAEAQTNLAMGELWWCHRDGSLLSTEVLGPTSIQGGLRGFSLQDIGVELNRDKYPYLVVTWIALLCSIAIELNPAKGTVIISILINHKLFQSQ